MVVLDQPSFALLHYDSDKQESIFSLRSYLLLLWWLLFSSPIANSAHAALYTPPNALFCTSHMLALPTTCQRSATYIYASSSSSSSLFLLFFLDLYWLWQLLIFVVYVCHDKLIFCG
jgi:hypothetical protein